MRERRTKYSRSEARLGEIRERDAGNGQLVRMVKIRMDGESGKRWIPFARWWWEQNRGPVPPGRRICHADGILLNDDPDNLVALTPGEVFNLYHKLDPEMSRSNREACGRSAAKRNVEAAAAFRETNWLPTRWYAVDFTARLIYPASRRMRWMVYADHGFTERFAQKFDQFLAMARDGDTLAAAYVVDQTSKLDQWCRWLRSASLGWPGTSCMTACILHVLSQRPDGCSPGEIIAAVGELRRLFGWNPIRLDARVLSSCVSCRKDWIRTDRGRHTVHRITDAGIEVRIDSPLVVPIRGRDLPADRFVGFTRVQNLGEARAA